MTLEDELARTKRTLALIADERDRLVSERDFYRERMHTLERLITAASAVAANPTQVR